MDPFTLFALAALYCGKGIASEIKKSSSSGNKSSNGSTSSTQSKTTTSSSSQCNTSASQTKIKKEAKNCAWQQEIKLNNKNKTK